MIVNFDKMYLEVKTEESRSEKITSATPQIHFIKSHKNDIEKEMGAIKAFCIYANWNLPGKIKTVWDLMAGTGFGSRIFQKYLKPNKLLLNDLDKLSTDILKFNFEESTVWNKDVMDIDYKKKADLIAIDFNNFTLKKMPFWNPLLSVLNSPYLLLTDSASYGFKFGKVNLKAYGVIKPIEYYHKLSLKMGTEYNYGLTTLFPFGNACLCLFEKDNLGKYRQPEIIESEKIPFHVSQTKGFSIL